MPDNTVSGFVLDSYGRPAMWLGGGMGPGNTGGGAYGALHRRGADDDRLRPRPANHFADYLALLSPYRYRELVSECRAIASHGMVPALLENRADYVSASGYAPRFIGHDAAFGEKLLSALTEALKICNLRGPRFTWRDTWRMGGTTRATDGSYFINLTQWGDSGWPAIQMLEGHRIGSRNVFSSIVGDDDALTIITTEDGKKKEVRGAYRGMVINNGIIYNNQGTEVAYRVLGATAEEDEDISARDMIHVARPRRASEGRPAPDLAGASLDFLAADLAQTCQLDQQIQDARLTLIEMNASGRYEPGAAFQANNLPSGGTAAGTPTTIEDRAQTRFIKTGMSLTPHQAQRPSDQWMNFDQRVLSRAAAQLGWRLEMMDPKELGGIAGRAFQDQINTTIFSEFAIEATPCVRVMRYFAAKLAQLGAVENHAELLSLGVATPPWFEVDRASARIDLEEVAAGRIAMSTLHGRDGMTTAEVYAERANAYELALAIKKKHPDVPLDIIIGDLGMTAQRTGNYPGTDGSGTDPLKTDLKKIAA